MDIYVDEDRWKLDEREGNGREGNGRVCGFVVR
jgi:hypothetical protein